MPTVKIRCKNCGETFEIVATKEQLTEWQQPKSERRTPQEIFPEFSTEQRNLLLTRWCANCWEELFKVLE